MTIAKNYYDDDKDNEINGNDGDVDDSGDGNGLND